MVDRVFNFAAGPAVMPLSVLETAAQEMTNYRGRGMSVMEMSHRTKMYLEIFDDAVACVKSLMHVPDTHEILFLQGGATGQFAAVAMNLMTGSGKADYIDSGNFAAGAANEAAKYGTVRVVKSAKADNYRYVPSCTQADFDPDADYVHITANNTIYGTRYPELPDTGALPLVCDASSSVLSEPFELAKFGVLYAGAQKNIGPAGVTLVIVRKDLLGRAMKSTPKILNWQKMAESGSMLNTPPTYAIYLCGLCLHWLKEQGGVEAMTQVNIEKAKLLYDVIDDGTFYLGAADAPFRSRMNVTFRTASEELDALFVKEAAENGLVNLKGHRAAGGMRASIYNAMPVEGVLKLRDFMKEFEARH